MKIRRTTMAIVAAGALVLTGCTSDSGDSGGDGGDGGSDGGSSDGGGSEDEAGSSEGGEATDTGKADLGDITTNDDTISFSSGEVEWEAYNGATSATNSTYNAVVDAQMQGAFWYFGTDGTVYPNEDYGTYEKTSDDPLTVEYTISDEAKWSDGTDVTALDFMLDWASSNPASIYGEKEGAGDFDPVSDTFGKYVPDGVQADSPDSKSFTVVYPEPYPDWELVVSQPMPAHIAAQEAGMSPEELGTAITEGDAGALEPVAKFWNDGWIFDSGKLPDPAIVPSSGPYTLDGATWSAGESLTLVPNENYWGTPPATGNLQFRFVAPEAQTQALANGDLDVIEPQATVDTVTEIEGMGDAFTVDTSPSLTWEHLDYNFAESSPFADENGGLAAREAFALCVPRADIVANLVQPIDPEAEVMNAREVFPFQDTYQEVVDEAYDGRYDTVDIEAAKAKFEESGLEDGVEIRIGYSAPNQRRTEEVALIKSSCDQAGFSITDTGNADFFADGGDLSNGDWEIALFAWAGSGQRASGEPIYSTGGGQNFGGFSNDEVDAAWDTLASTVDDTEILDQVKVIEKLLWDNLYGIPLFAHPTVVAYDSTIENVRPNASQTGVSWNAEQWVRAE